MRPSLHGLIARLKTGNSGKVGEMVKSVGITPENSVFIIVSFEGPDTYSLAGGLGVRVDGLSNTLACQGFPVHLFFVGDPYLAGEQHLARNRLTLHRWCQWISRYYPEGVYQGEEDKLRDFDGSLPGFIVEHVVRKALSEEKTVVIMGEEWQTAGAVQLISDYLTLAGIRDRVIIFWNANNTFGFHRIDWRLLSRSARITTVSRYMKHLMWKQGVNPLVIPNGIDPSLLNEVDQKLVARLKEIVRAEILLAKVARWDPDKRWLTAVGAVSKLKQSGRQPVLLARGGIEAHGKEVMEYAASRGLKVRPAFAEGTSPTDYLNAISGAVPGEIIDMKFPIVQSFLRAIYQASDAVLANSGHEPFGLVGLETMAAEGVAFTGGTGEDYAMPYYNSIVLETDDPVEIEVALKYLEQHPFEEARMRKAARQTAGYFTWEEAVKNLIWKLEYQGEIQGMLDLPDARKAPSSVSSLLEPQAAKGHQGRSPAEREFQLA